MQYVCTVSLESVYQESISILLLADFEGQFLRDPIDLPPRSSELIPSAKYNLLNGWQGNVQYGKRSGGNRQAKTKMMPQCMENIDLIPPYNRARILLAYSSVLEWTAEELQRLVRTAEKQIRDGFFTHSSFVSHHVSAQLRR